jgi:hypothetical protein
MDLEKALLEEAQYAVSDLKNRARALEPQLKEIKKLKLEIEAECQSGRLALKRLLQYEFKIGTEYHCPRCWIYHERRSALHPASSAAADRAIMRCQTCAADFVISTR